MCATVVHQRQSPGEVTWRAKGSVLMFVCFFAHHLTPAAYLFVVLRLIDFDYI